MIETTMTASEKSIVLDLGEMRVEKDESAVLTCLGIGSCLALCAYDPVSKVGGMTHMVLPASNGNIKEKSAKYVDTGVLLLFEEMRKRGAVKSRLDIKVAGGAQMFIIPGSASRLDVGKRNVEELELALAKEGVSVSAADLGGTVGRSVRLFLDSGKVTVKTGAGVREL